jgi:adenylosuccinate synthase
MNVSNVDICVGLAWGDEAKGKITAHLSKENDYDFVCRWAGGNNAGHTIHMNNQKYVTNLIPSGIFHNVKSIIGPDCVVNIEHFFEEINYLKENGFNTNLIKISPKAHIITDEHIEEDIQKYKKLGTTARGIAPCYRDKYGRTGERVIDHIDKLKDFIWDENLYGNVLCEGAQGFWLDINYGNYPYITSSNTLPYSSCSLGFPPCLINNIYGAVKIYDTRVGYDPDFPETLLDDPDLQKLGEIGEEYGSTTGRKRIVNWLNLDKLIKAINISGTTHLVISKVDIIEQLGVYKYYYNNQLINVDNSDNMQEEISINILTNTLFCKHIYFSNNPYSI